MLYQVIRNNDNHFEEIKNLQPFSTSINGKNVVINFKVVDSMHDNKEVVILAKAVLRYSFSFAFI